MTTAQQKLHDAISDLDKFAAHNVGHISGTTSSFEKMLLETAASAARLRAALRNNKDISGSLDAYEAAFNSMAMMSSGITHGTKIATISDEEVEEMLDLLDAVRDEIKE